jgi:hypothetical protein
MIVVDRAAQLTLAEVEQLAEQLGPVGVAGYSGGPCAASPWAPNGFEPLRSAGVEVFSFWVGSQTNCYDFSPETAAFQGARATTDADRRAILDRPLILDVESGTWDHTPRAELLTYVDTWCAAVLSHGGRPWLYGVRDLVDAAASQNGWDGFWVADWLPGDPPAPPSLSGHPGGPGGRARQYAGGVNVRGLTVDLSVVEESIVHYLLPGPPADAAELQARRVKIHEWGHLPGFMPPPNWPAESAMDVLLTEWVANGAEGVFQTLFGA